MDTIITQTRTSDLRDRLKMMTRNYQNKIHTSDMHDLNLHLKVLNCLDELEETIQYSNYSTF